MQSTVISTSKREKNWYQSWRRFMRKYLRHFYITLRKKVISIPHDIQQWTIWSLQKNSNLNILKGRACPICQEELALKFPEVKDSKIIRERLTWWRDLSACFLFFLADDVTLLRSLYTIKVSSIFSNIVANREFHEHGGHTHRCGSNKWQTLNGKINKVIPSTPLYCRDTHVLIKLSAIFCIVHSSLPPKTLAQRKLVSTLHHDKESWYSSMIIER